MILSQKKKAISIQWQRIYYTNKKFGIDTKCIEYHSFFFTQIDSYVHKCFYINTHTYDWKIQLLA